MDFTEGIRFESESTKSVFIISIGHWFGSQLRKGINQSVLVGGLE